MVLNVNKTIFVLKNKNKITFLFETNLYIIYKMKNLQMSAIMDREELRGEIRNQNNGFDIVFVGLSLSVTDENLMREEYKKIGWKRFVPFYKRRKISKIKKKILENVTGTFRNQRFTAIMGASGAGKTSLLAQIAGEIPKEFETSGELFVQGQRLENTALKSISGFVFQDDVILETMTVEEAFKMSARLRLPPEIDKKERVERMIKETSLEKARKTRIGGKKGVSGGERKRTSTWHK